MQTAAFSLTRYYFDKVNIDLEKKISDNISISFVTEGMFVEDESKFHLRFLIIVFNEEKSVDEPFTSIQCVGTFDFVEITKLEKIPDYFYRNAIAILFPYLRAYLSIVTNQANVSGILLPTYNLSSLEENLKENTISK